MFYIVESDKSTHEWCLDDNYPPAVVIWKVIGLQADGSEANAIINLFTHNGTCTIPYAKGESTQSWYGDLAKTIFAALGNAGHSTLRSLANRNPA